MPTPPFPFPPGAPVEPLTFLPLLEGWNALYCSLGVNEPWEATTARPKQHTLPETNIAPEKQPLEKEIPTGNHHFWGLCWFEGVYLFCRISIVKQMLNAVKIYQLCESGRA